ncbi:MAG TPA: molybdenum cofactor biosynthesis protein MoaE [Mycobacteriales bacterium]|jgi:molybdopterin synthase catalytic subunit|nr:molybdenum cofactor biosynthesis protein MoaE [Mycobacteriales bacterium]
MSKPTVLTTVTAAPLDRAMQREFVGRPAAGAIVTFEGVIRDNDQGRGVIGLRYEAHPSASAVLDVIADRYRDTVLAVAVEHRIGELAIGEIALLCTVAATHRIEAFQICADLVDTVKAELPIWKHQRFTDGSTEWVGL